MENRLSRLGYRERSDFSRTLSSLMLGHRYNCSACDFTFISGWSRAENGLFLICWRCAARFILGHGVSTLGPTDGETLSLRFLGSTEAAIQCTTSIGIAQQDADRNGNVVVQLRYTLPLCPNCCNEQTILQRFTNGNPCPECKSGRIVDAGIVDNDSSTGG